MLLDYADEGEGTFDDIRSVEVARRIARLRDKHGVGLNDALRSYTPEQREASFGRKLTEGEVIRNLEDFEAELDRTRALGGVRDKDWTLEGLRRVRTNLGDREPKNPDGENDLGLVKHIKTGDRVIAQTIVFKPTLSESEVRGMAAGDGVFVSTMFARESERTPEAGKRYVIRHELGHALQNAKGPISPVLSALKISAMRKLSIQAADTEAGDNELVAELFAWYHSPDYASGDLPLEIEKIIEGWKDSDNGSLWKIVAYEGKRYEAIQRDLMANLAKVNDGWLPDVSEAGVADYGTMLFLIVTGKLLPPTATDEGDLP
ncbi:hypothetical protein [Iodidimonas gelatinilytica]|uniref:hypothetical protein n=1 Tax=Iodidimonas gelatinilytica TaxID=1236966 RepID=UPI00123148CF|nr:hypothetical protein [Iodidimonas gelatinilytica]